MPGRHDDDHRLGFSGGDQIVENEIRPADRGPRIVAVARAVEQIENGIFVLPGLISRRRVDMHPSRSPEPLE